jgi:DNA-binding transcriptional regulator YiaG
MKTRYPDKTEVPVTIPTLDGKAVAETITITVPCRIDAKSGEVTLGGEALQMIDRVRARHMGLMQPEEIRGLRQCLGLTQKDMSELLQIGAKSYTRWESGRERPFRSMNILLRALWDGKLDVSYLRSIQSAEFNWWPMVDRLMGSRNANPYTVDVSREKETCREIERAAA